MVLFVEVRDIGRFGVRLLRHALAQIGVTARAQPIARLDKRCTAAAMLQMTSRAGRPSAGLFRGVMVGAFVASRALGIRRMGLPKPGSEPIGCIYRSVCLVARRALIVKDTVSDGEMARAMPGPSWEILHPGIGPAPRDDCCHQQRRGPKSPALDKARARKDAGATRAKSIFSDLPACGCSSDFGDDIGLPPGLGAFRCLTPQVLLLPCG